MSKLIFCVKTVFFASTLSFHYSRSLLNRAHFDPFHFGRTPISAGPNQVYSRDDDNNEQPRRSRRHQQQSAENQVCSCDDDNNNNKQPRRPRRRQQQSAKNQVYSRDNNKQQQQQQQQTTAKTAVTMPTTISSTVATTTKTTNNNKQPRRLRRHQQQSAENQVYSHDDDDDNKQTTTNSQDGRDDAVAYNFSLERSKSSGQRTGLGQHAESFKRLRLFTVGRRRQAFVIRGGNVFSVLHRKDLSSSVLQLAAPYRWGYESEEPWKMGRQPFREQRPTTRLGATRRIF